MKRPPAFSLSRALGAWALLLPGVVAFQPTFGGLRGYAAAFVGITVGAAIALVAARFRWSTALWFAALLGLLPPHRRTLGAPGDDDRSGSSPRWRPSAGWCC